MPERASSAAVDRAFAEVAGGARMPDERPGLLDEAERLLERRRAKKQAKKKDDLDLDDVWG